MNGPAAMNTDHVNSVQTDRHVVEMTSRSDGTSEWCTIEYAIERLRGYYNDDPPGWIEDAIRTGTMLRTVSFLYRITR